MRSFRFVLTALSIAECRSWTSVSRMWRFIFNCGLVFEIFCWSFNPICDHKVVEPEESSSALFLKIFVGGIHFTCDDCRFLFRFRFEFRLILRARVINDERTCQNILVYLSSKGKSIALPSQCPFQWTFSSLHNKRRRREIISCFFFLFLSSRRCQCLRIFDDKSSGSCHFAGNFLYRSLCDDCWITNWFLMVLKSHKRNRLLII